MFQGGRDVRNCPGLSFSIGVLEQKALTLQISEEGDSNIDSLFIDVRSHEIQLTPTKVSKKPPPSLRFE